MWFRWRSVELCLGWIHFIVWTEQLYPLDSVLDGTTQLALRFGEIWTLVLDGLIPYFLDRALGFGQSKSIRDLDRTILSFRNPRQRRTGTTRRLLINTESVLYLLLRELDINSITLSLTLSAGLQFINGTTLYDGKRSFKLIMKENEKVFWLRNTTLGCQSGREGKKRGGKEWNVKRWKNVWEKRRKKNEKRKTEYEKKEAE